MKIGIKKKKKLAPTFEHGLLLPHDFHIGYNLGDRRGHKGETIACNHIEGVAIEDLGVGGVCLHNVPTKYPTKIEENKGREKREGWGSPVLL